ncbi:MAG: hypothetical protein HN742_42430 [Lentisphaerae bacterium]|mgnify:CR=1 FL=1|jgi:hypothetical protein|nr:hypothetical protein [Lentisphaerota bacterium]MBT4818483.1 hypothetical protein [Lentisphaerota bacterium]MBT5605410.1 hypothetical protein [Lentisphaerota bacterium]MBT7062034.1 hypothetical protein [Lentisphaerota bacterium]MBT7848596.1 hypothetical protein [Lentisphaerota bacterium]
MRGLRIRAAAVAAALLCLATRADEAVLIAAGGASAPNVLTDAGFEEGATSWRSWQSGFKRTSDGTARSGNACIRLVSTDLETQYGACQEITLNQTSPTPIVARAWSRAESISGTAGKGYSLYLDIQYTDGSHLWSQTSAFPTGTHDWVRREVMIAPEKPIKLVLCYVLLRGHTGTAWFDDVSFSVMDDGEMFDMALVQRPEAPMRSPGAGHSVKAGKGFTLQFGREGRVLTCGAATPPSPGMPPAPSGFLLRDVAAQSDFIRPSLKSASPGPRGLELAVDSSQLNLRLSAEFSPKVSWIDVTGTLEDTSATNRAISVYFAIPFAAKDAVWWNDVAASQPLGQGTESRRWTMIGVGANGYVSPYPWCAVSAPGRGLSICVPPDRPQVMRLAWSSGVLYVVFDLGLSAATTKHPQRADFAFSIYPHEPTWGFRDATQRYYDMFPDAFAKRVTSEGTWLITRSVKAIRNAEDFHLKFHETGHRADPAGPALGIQSFRYVEPWRWRQRYKGKGTEELRTKAGSLAELKRRFTSDDANLRRNSLAVENSVCQDENGESVMYIEDAPWGTSALFVCNADPAVPRTGQEAINQADCYYSEAIANQRYGSGVEPEQDGEYIDSVEGFTWPRIQNYRRDHIAVADYPLTFGTQTRKPCILNAFGHWAFLKATGEDLHRRGKLMFGNAMFSRFAYYFGPYFDVLGTEHHWISRKDGSWTPENEARTNYRRALSRTRPYLMLLNTDFKKMSHATVEMYFRRCAFFGLFPSMFSHDAFHDRYFDDPVYHDRDRDLFKKYIPLILALSEAGWRPVTGARSANPKIRIERFGDAPRVYLTVLNTDQTEEQGAVVQLDPSVLPGVVTQLTEEFTGQDLEDDDTMAVRLAPGDTAMLAFALTHNEQP